MTTHTVQAGRTEGLPRILLLSGACLVGQNIVAALAQRRDQLVLHATNSKADEPALFDFDTAYLTPSVAADPLAFAARFDEILGEFAPDLVIPCRDDDVAFLAAQAERNPGARRTTYLCGPHLIANALLDKWESRCFSAAYGLPFAATIRSDTTADKLATFVREHGFPLIAKPIQGFASRGVLLVSNRDQLEMLAGRQDYIIQEYLGDAEAVYAYAANAVREGVPLFHTFERTKHSIQACISPEGRITGVMASRNLMRFGRSERVEVETDPELQAAGTRWAAIFAEAGWRGPLNIQCQRGRDGHLRIYEYNGRFTGATAARCLLGFDEVGIVLRDWLGYDLRPITPPSGAHSVIRAMTSRVLDPGKIAAIGRESVWRSLHPGS